MTAKVVLIHTSFALLGNDHTLFDIFRELLPDVGLINIVDDGMLKEVMMKGQITPDVTLRMCYYVLAANAMGVDAIFSTCSSLGAAASVAKELVDIPVIKIDEAMAEKAAREGHRISVLASVSTTLQPTISLIKEKSVLIGRKVELRPLLCEGAFELLMNGTVEAHDELIASKAKEVSQWADTLVLAQCTLARLAPRLSEETKLSVLTSPRLGVEHLKRVLNQ